MGKASFDTENIPFNNSVKFSIVTWPVKKVICLKTMRCMFVVLVKIDSVTLL